MRIRTLITCVTLGIAVALGFTAEAWGPKTQVAIVTTAVHMLSKEGNIPLGRLEKETRDGAMVSIDTLKKMHVALDAEPVAAIESEMYVLRAAFSGKSDGRRRLVDAYFAYRLGMLGKLVAEALSPMRKVEATYRNLYYADVEKQVQRTEIRTASRRPVEPRLYFPPLISEANLQNELFRKEYQSGVGFKGQAKASLSKDISRAINAVADVWFTVLTEDTVAGIISDVPLQRYVLDAYAFYIRRGNKAEIAAADARLETLAAKTPEMHAQMGDMFFKAALYERAIEEYTRVLDAAPDRRDVIEKIAGYYVDVGVEALQESKLEAALEAYTKALAVDPIFPGAETKRIEVRSLIADRDARLAADRAAIDKAYELITFAEQKALEERYAEGVTILAQASETFRQVTEEFPEENQKRIRGQREIQYRMREFREALVGNAARFSGTGFALDTREMARRSVRELDTQALEQLIEHDLDAGLKTLADRMRPALQVQ